MTRDQIDILAKKYASGDATKEEILLFDAFMENMHLNNCEDCVGDENSLYLEKRILNKLHATIVNKKSIKRTLWNNAIEWRAVAASVLVLFGVWASLQYLLPSESHVDNSTIAYSVRTQPGEKTKVVLSDGSVIIVNSDSEITYSDFKNSRVREVYLRGEAFFEVAKDVNRPFVVKTNHLTTHVLGTSFNISSYDDYALMHVTVATGKVRVEDEKGGRIFELNPAQQLSYNKNNSEISQKELDTLPFVAWKDNVIVFDSMAMKEVARVLERWYGISVKIEGDMLASKTITGRYQNDRIYNILEGLTFLLDANYRFEGESSVVIYE